MILGFRHKGLERGRERLFTKNEARGVESRQVTMGDVIRSTGGSRNTLKQHFRALVEQGHLTQRGSGRGVWYEVR